MRRILFVACLLVADTGARAVGQSAGRAPCTGVYQHRVLGERGWRVRIQLDPCVRASDAVRILRSLRQRSLVNRQPKILAGPLAGQVPSVPDVQLWQVQWIALSDERSTEGPVGAVVYGVHVRSTDSALRGLVLHVSLRGDEVEVWSVGGWIE